MACPLCADTFDSRTDVRRHLEVEHRKSELSRFLVERLDERTDPLLSGEERLGEPDSTGISD